MSAESLMQPHVSTRTKGRSASMRWEVFAEDELILEASDRRGVLVSQVGPDTFRVAPHPFSAITRSPRYQQKVREILEASATLAECLERLRAEVKAARG